MPDKKHIVLVTTKQPSSNPRLVKEAIGLVDADYRVTVIYNFWGYWAEEADKLIIEANSKINWIKAGDGPQKSKLTYWYTRVRYKAYRILAALFSKNLKLLTRASTQFYFELNKSASLVKGDLYIAHNLGALAIAANAAKKNNSKYSFDAEDFHRGQEENDHKLTNAITLIEDYYLPKAAFITAASPLIAAEYRKHYPSLDFIIINNFFSIKHQPAFIQLNKHPLKLFWFSQTVGLNRGLQDVIMALNQISEFVVHFSILGDLNSKTRQNLQSILSNKNHTLTFLPPCDEKKLLVLSAQHHVGLAIEPGFSINNKIALSNKLFTYLLAGNAVILSATPAQIFFFQQYPEIGWCYSSGDITALASIIKNSYYDETSLCTKRLNAWQLANKKLNWETERNIFLRQIKLTV